MFYQDGLEVEFGVVTELWVDEPLDDGTKNVALNGFKVVTDKESVFTNVIAFLENDE